MKIGVWIDKPLDKTSGGSFTYFNTLIEGIDNFNFVRPIEIVFISAGTLTGFNKPFIDIAPHQRGIYVFTKIIRKAFKLISKKLFKNVIDAIDQKEKRTKDISAAAYLNTREVGIIFYPLPASHIIHGIPYILNNWDLAHYTTYAFPEITGDNGFYGRNDWYTTIMPSALMVFTETYSGKKELVNYLNFNPDKIRVVPMFSSNNLTGIELSIEDQQALLIKMRLKKQRFFFYPAQYWAHKNHYTLVKAFKKFVLQYPDYKLFLCGSDKGNLAYIKACVKTFELESNVIFGGFVEDNELYTLYKNATALIMPTFSGPSNIPPIEALFLNCPVLCSDLDGHKEILSDAGVYFNPADELAILESMLTIVDVATRLNILQKLQQQASVTDHTIQKALMKLEGHLMEAINIRSCWE